MYKLSPSKAHRFLQCTKSLEFDIEFVETPASIRGSILHEYAQMILNSSNDIEQYYKEHNINSYEQFLVTSYAKAVWDEYFRIDAYKIEVENKHPIEIYGNTINLIIDALVLSKNEASILDLKSGNGEVDVHENEQLFFYGYAVLQRYPYIKKVTLSIFQKGKLKTVHKTANEIYDFFVEKHEIFDKIQKNMLEYNPSDKACKFCPIKNTCVARAKWIIGGKP